MKLKSKPVTNSSSTSFIVCIPNDFHIEDLENFDDHIDNAFDNQDDYADLEEFRANLTSHFETLKHGNYLEEYGQNEMFDIIEKICEDRAFVITRFNGGADMGCIKGLKIEDLDKKVKDLTEGKWKDKE